MVEIKVLTKATTENSLTAAAEVCGQDKAKAAVFEEVDVVGNGS